MRIAFIGGFAFSPKGTIRARAHPLAAELVRRGDEVTIFLPPYDNLADSGREWEQDGVRIHNSQAGGSPLSHARLLARLVLEINNYRPDVIHVFKPKGFAGAAGSYFLLRNSHKLVLDCDDWEGWGGWNEVKPYPWVLKEYIDRQERWMVRTAPVVTVASRTLATRAADLRGSSAGVYYVPNAVASSARAAQDSVRARSQQQIRDRLGLPDCPTVLYSGHFDGVEDTDLFCRAMVSVAADCSASLLLVGDGADRDHIRAQFSKSRNVRLFFFPNLEYDNFLQVIWAADIAAFPFRDDRVHHAKCSARIIDYMAMGKAVLTSAVGQNCEYIVNGESGILARPGDEIDFANKLRMLVRDRDLREHLGRNAERRINDNFTWSGEPLQQCLAAYEQLDGAAAKAA